MGLGRPPGCWRYWRDDVERGMRAAALNVVPLGLGYLYLRLKVRFVVALALGLLAPMVGLFAFVAFLSLLGYDAWCFADCSYAPPWIFRLGVLIGVLPLTGVAAFTAWDAYCQGRARG